MAKQKKRPAENKPKMSSIQMITAFLSVISEAIQVTTLKVWEKITCNGGADKVEDFKNDERPEEEKKNFRTTFEIIHDYSEYANIQGLVYVFLSYQTWFGKLFWALVIFLMSLLGLYWCIQAYSDWRNNPVMTTVSTTAFSVKQVEFPAVTICSPGMSRENMEAGYYRFFFNYLEDVLNITVLSSPYYAAYLMNNKLSSNEEENREKLHGLLQSSYYVQFLNERFPGLTVDDDIQGFLKLMTSKDPGCVDNFTPGWLSTAWDSSLQERGSVNCVQVLDAQGNQSFARSSCWQQDIWYLGDIQSNVGAEMPFFVDNDDVEDFLGIFRSGRLTIPDDNSFFLKINKWGNAFYISTGNSWKEINQTNYPSIQINDIDGDNLECLSAKYDRNSTKLIATPTSCDASLGIVCMTKSYCKYETCYRPVINMNKLGVLVLNPNDEGKKNVTSQRQAVFTEMMARLKHAEAFRGLFSSLWYSSFPCYDIKNLTAEYNGERAVIKYCEWKGLPISCASIFSPLPTDQGICCSFNMKAADDIYHASPYSKIITELQEVDDAVSFEDSNLPEWYKEASEPTSYPGRNKGLYLILDAHMDQFSSSSQFNDFDGFTGLIHPSGSYPFMSLEGFQIKAGHLNDIALSGTRIDADNDMKDMDVSVRKCKFPSDASDMKIYKEYSYTNCMIECSLLHAKNMMAQNNSFACIPWYFPTTADQSTHVCNPWQALTFLDYMTNVPDHVCQCLPDCSGTIYDTQVISSPIRRCDSSSLGVSKLCGLSNSIKSYQPTLPGGQTRLEFEALFRDQSPKLHGVESLTRTYAKKLKYGDMFNLNPKSYDAFEKDIAVVEIFFRKPTIIQMNRKPKMTWIDYFSTVGGLLGLVLGMGIVSVIELFWLCLRIVALKLNFQNLVP